MHTPLMIIARIPGCSDVPLVVNCQKDAPKQLPHVKGTLMKRLLMYYTKQSRIKKISDVIFLAAIAMSIYTFIIIRLSTANLPPNVCPVEKHHAEIYFAITLLVASIIISFFEPKKKNIK
jgi:hypothetical protein